MLKIYTPKIVFAMSILNKARRTGAVECQRSKQEMSHVIFEDRDDHTYLFWHLQLCRFAARDADDTDSLWRHLIDCALAALQRRDYGELERIIYEIDRNYNDGADAEAERLRRISEP